VKEGPDLGGHQNPHGLQPGGLDAECASLARALDQLRKGRQHRNKSRFSRTQAAIRRMASEEPGPGQQYELQARKHIATLRRVRPSIIIEIRWCPAHKGVAGNEKEDKWAKLAAGEPDARGVEWLRYLDWGEAREMPLPRSLAHFKREITEKKWVEAHQWAGGRTSKKKYTLQKSLTAWLWVVPRGCLKVLPDKDRALPHRAEPSLDGKSTHPPLLVVPVSDADPEPPLQGVPRVEAAAEDPGGGGV